MPPLVRDTHHLMIEPPRHDPSRLRVVSRRDAGRPSARATSAGRPRSPRVPRFVATLAGLAGIVSLLSAAISPLQEPVHVLTAIVPLAVRASATSVAALAGLGTLIVAGGLARRARLAWWITLGLLIVAGVSHLLKDLDVPQTAFDIGLAVVLVFYRQEFDARTGPGTIRRAVVALPVLLAVVWGFGVVAIVSHADVIGTSLSVGDAMVASFRGMVGLDMRLAVTGEAGRWIPGLMPVLGVMAAVWAFAAALRPVVEDLRRSPADADAAAAIVRSHGADTLSYFALRKDKSYYFEDDAFVAYRYLWNLGLVSGDPIGHAADRSRVIEGFVRYAREMG